jgi:penicillin-binding protein 1A
VASIGSILLVSACLYLYLSPKLPSAEELKDVQMQIPLRVTSKELKVIREFGEKKRTPVAFDDLPKDMVNALLAAEDATFFEHKGIVVSGLVRSAIQLISEGRAVSGGSTITMQVARNFFFHKRKEFTRKFNEILLAFRIENELTKKEIFSLYANKIFLGKTAYGFAAAAQVYYGKDLEELSLAQIAMIAGLPKAPSAFNPIANPERATERRNWILGRMLKLESITEQQYFDAVNEDDNASYYGSKSELNAEYVAEMIRQDVIAKFGLKAYTEGYTAVTTIDSSMQKSGVTALQSGILSYDKRHGYRGSELQSIDKEAWVKTLKETPIIGELEPAIITKVADDRLQIMTKDLLAQTINWSDGLKDLRMYKTVNTISQPISSAKDIFSEGDLIRVLRRENNQFELVQLPEVQAALVAIDPSNGAIRTLVGGFDYNQSRFNRVTSAARQPGSNFKPFIYATALNNGFTPASIINDAPVVFDDVKLEQAWRPENDGGKFYGPTRLREALYRSRNLVSIRLLRRMGIDRTLEGLQSFGLDTSEMPLDLSLALGSHALTPLQIASGYALFANGGYQIQPYLLDKVVDRNGKIIYQAVPATVCSDCGGTGRPTSLSNDAITDVDSELEALFNNLEMVAIEQGEKYSWERVKQQLSISMDSPTKPANLVMEPQIAFQMDSMLKDVILRGTGKKAMSLKRSDLGGKTGTTNGPRDAWFSGYSPHLVTTAWVGFDNNSVIGRNEYGGSAALPIWIELMSTALQDKPDMVRKQPTGIVTVKIDPETGQRVSPGKEGIYEFFRIDNVPNAPDQDSLGSKKERDRLPDDIF